MCISRQVLTSRWFKVTSTHVEQLAERMLASGLKPKSVRNVLGFLRSIFERAKTTQIYARYAPFTHEVARRNMAGHFRCHADGAADRVRWTWFNDGSGASTVARLG